MKEKNVKIINALKNIVYISEFGLSIILPIILFVFFGVAIRDYFRLNNIVVFIFLIIGLFFSVTNMVTLIKSILKDIDKTKKNLEDR